MINGLLQGGILSKFFLSIWNFLYNFFYAAVLFKGIYVFALFPGINVADNKIIKNFNKVFDKKVFIHKVTFEIKQKLVHANGK